MAKYDALEVHLRNLPGDAVRLTFAEINDILPSPLPRSAYKHPPFWSNTAVGGTHVWADAWQRAGWRTTGHHFEQQYVDFRRVRDKPSGELRDHAQPQNETEASRSGQDAPAVNPNDHWQESEEKQLAEIWTRRGQPNFRDRLLRAYSATCAVSGSMVEPVLEAAHIVPHALETNYATTNGLLLRADIHTLFDLHLISVDASGRVAVSRSLEWTEYAQFRGRLVVLPVDREERPSLDQLERHHDLFVAREEALDG
ncbi:HNH endonuclease [Ralstonia pseudosolanacearum]|uniref:HNH endonuclease n=1 Tax=Ralstonia pseudosolanacearum TaxID=1310165 RepID=UPI002234254E|nr:HNH endonuclease [Ralstonia sp. RS647]UZF34536.1 HNH endonuclease [Ralstonia sp. RS647]